MAQIDIKELTALLTDTKPIWSNPITISTANWVVFSDDWFYSMNGIFHYKSRWPVNENFMIPAPDVLELIRTASDGTVEVEPIKDGVKLRIAPDGGVEAIVEFSYPCKFSDSLNSFYEEMEGPQCQVSGIRQALEFTTNFAFRENVEYSNTYVVNGCDAIATDGYRIVKHSIDCPDTQFPYGLNKILTTIGEPTAMYQNESSVTLVSDTYKLSCAKTIGRSESITKYIPDVKPLKLSLTIGNVDEFRDIINKMKRLSEFKKQDKFVRICGSRKGLDIEMDNISKRFKFRLEDTKTLTPFSFKVHPDHILSLVEISPTFRFNPEESFIYAYCIEPIKNMVVWVEYEKNSGTT